MEGVKFLFSGTICGFLGLCATTQKIMNYVFSAVKTSMLHYVGDSLCSAVSVKVNMQYLLKPEYSL